MNALRLVARGMDDHHRHFQAERRTSAEPCAGRFDSPSMHFGQLLCNSEPQSQATVGAGNSRIPLPKPLEHMWQELWGDADAGVTDRHLQVGIHALEANLDLAAFP